MAQYPAQGDNPWDEPLKNYIDDQDAGKADEADLSAHVANTSNPHGVTKSQVGLSNVDNTSDAAKPVSTAQAAAIATVQSDVDAHEADTSNPHAVTKAQVGLSNVDNTSDANKPVSTAQQTALNLKANIADLADVAFTGSYNDLSETPAPGGGGGSAKPKVAWVLADGATDPTASSGAGTTNTGLSGSVNWGQSHGTLLITSNTLNSYASLYLSDPSIGVGASYGWWGAIYDRTFTIIIQAGMTITSNSSLFLGMNDAFNVPSGTNKHVGFRCDNSGGDGATQTWYATNGNGTATTTTDITAAVTGALGYYPTYFYAAQNFVIEYSPTEIRFYFNGVLVATHTTNIPSGDNASRPNTSMIAYIKNLQSGASSVVSVNRFIIEADAY